MSAAQPLTGSAFDRVIDALERAGSVRAGRDWQCPAHDDSNPSLSVKDGGGRALVHCFKGCEPKAIAEALGLSMGDLFDEPLNGKESNPIPPAIMHEVARYEYEDRAGGIVSTKVRREPVQNPDGKKTFWWDNGNPHALYRMPELVEADRVWLNEGEKAADRMASELPPGHAATCAPTPKWEDGFAECLTGKIVTIIADRDKEGIKQAREALESLRAAGVQATIVQAAVVTEKADAFDHFEAGFGVDDFVALAIESSSQDDEVEARAWPFFLGGEADGSAEHAFVVEELIHAETMAMIVGRQGSLKTPLIMDVAAHVGQGIPYQGLPTTKGCTIYIAAEGAGAIGKRLAGIYKEHPALPSDAIVAITQPVALNDEAASDEFGEFLVTSVLPRLSMPVRMIVFDTMAKSIPGDSDSEDKIISALEKAARSIARRVSEANEDRFVPASVLIHHPRKNDNEYRGSGSIEGNLDTIIAISKTDAEKLEDRLYEVSLDKLKDGRDDRRWAYRAVLVHVGTTPKGKENYAPVVRYIDEAETLVAKAEAKTKGHQLSKNVKHLVELIVRIETRDGRSEVPRNVLSESGFLAHVTEQNWDSSVPVHGIRLVSLQDTFYSEDSEVGRSEDGQRTIPDRCRKRWERRREALISSGAAWICDGWLWLAGNNERTEDGR